MTTNTTNKNTAENVLQPVIYGVLPNQAEDEIDLGELFSRLISQWKLILAITAGGCLLAVLLAVLLPKVYKPTATVSMPLPGNLAPIINVNAQLGGYSITSVTRTKLKKTFSKDQLSTLNKLLGGNNAISATPEGIFRKYFNLLRADKMLASYITEKQYLKKLYPDAKKPASTLFAKLFKGFSVEVLEPKPQTKGGYVAKPKRIKISLDVKNEQTGVSLLNGYVKYINRQLINTLQVNVRNAINGRIKIISAKVVTQRDQARQSRLLTIKKIQYDDAKNIARLQAQIAASISKATLVRKTRIAEANEALKLAKALGVVNMSTMDIMAKKGMKSRDTGTNIAVVDKQSIPLYLYGSKYLNTLIGTLEKRKNDAIFLNNINTLKEKIQLIESDTQLAALKNRQSDDPWIAGLSEELAKISSLKKLKPDFNHVLAYTLDSSAIVTGNSVKPKRKLIVALGFVLSLFIGIFVALVVGAKKEARNE